MKPFICDSICLNAISIGVFHILFALEIFLVTLKFWIIVEKKRKNQKKMWEREMNDENERRRERTKEIQNHMYGYKMKFLHRH